jgi:hypoxanthine phosphoribosyltransferase
MRDKIIVFSSLEGLPIAKAIQRLLLDDSFEVTVWPDGFFKLSQSYISNFPNINLEYDFAVLICSNDDWAVVREEERPITRDNVILELGMCINSFTMERVIIIKNKDVKLPSDLDGIEYAQYTFDKDSAIDAAAGKICSHIDNFVKEYNKRHADYKKLSWDSFYTQVNKLFNTIKQSPRLGGYHVDILVGINRGGLMVADIISREYGQIMPVISLMADRRTDKTSFDSADLLINNDDIVAILSKPSIRNILVIDCMTRKGDTVIEAKEYLQSRLRDKTIKSAVVYANKSLQNNEKVTAAIDYIGCFENLDNLKLSLD